MWETGFLQELKGVWIFSKPPHRRDAQGMVQFKNPPQIGYLQSIPHNNDAVDMLVVE